MAAKKQTTTSNTTTTQVAVAKAAAKAAADTVTSLVLSSKSMPARYTEREPFFTIDGTTYTIPKVFAASTALRYLDTSARVSPDAALNEALHLALGDDGYQALIDSNVSPDELGTIAAVVRSRVLGSLSDPKDSSPSESGK